MSIFGTPFFTVMEKSLDAATLRQRVYANNIANIDTPGFKRSDVSFERQLQTYLQGNTAGQPLTGFRTDPRHIPIPGSGANMLQPTEYADSNTTVNNNGNNVDIDSEMTLIAKNQIQYNALVEQMNQQFSMLRSAINGGGA
ncbi:flagellar basal body rod protein FlgB [Fodinisporobacter ferrooxydans]|uniref:Flagellar basal body rod protein FlgB n=1 Tax=Fodinisporobacter ferrooxydans TaxID=2901836 RepID=A0ABY4CFP4_9BACL|nr:flagellar basal body rod protein FlgB [Alicyclobacillaceae bacterium MYW30-H2]